MIRDEDLIARAHGKPMKHCIQSASGVGHDRKVLGLGAKECSEPHSGHLVELLPHRSKVRGRRLSQLSAVPDVRSEGLGRCRGGIRVIEIDQVAVVTYDARTLSQKDSSVASTSASTSDASRKACSRTVAGRSRNGSESPARNAKADSLRKSRLSMIV